MFSVSCLDNLFHCITCYGQQLLHGVEMREEHAFRGRHWQPADEHLGALRRSTILIIVPIPSDGAFFFS